jgi:hypothetical protein
MEGAKFQNLPYELIESRQRNDGAMLCASDRIYKIFMSLEKHVLDPLFTNTSVMISLEKDFLIYVNLRTETAGYYDMVDDVLYKALESLNLSSENKTALVETIRLKLFNYYMKTATKDLIAFIMRTLDNDKAMSRLSFRASTLLESINTGKMSSSDENF